MKIILKTLIVILSVACVSPFFSHAWANGGSDPLSIVSETERILSEHSKHHVKQIDVSENIVLEDPIVPSESPELSEPDPSVPSVSSFDEAYVIGPSDKLRVTVYGEQELSKTYQVNGLGMVSVPLVGQVKVAGITLGQAEQLLSAALSDGYLVDPSVAIEIAEFRPFYIMGEVRRPGGYNYIDGMSVLNAVAVSGGFTYRANTKNIEVIRSNAQGETLKISPTAQVLPGDIIRVKERFF